MAKTSPNTVSGSPVALPKSTILDQYQALGLPDGNGANGDLSTNDGKKLLKRCEDAISANLNGFMAVGAALMTIQARKLHRHAGFETFVGYCRKRWDFGSSRAYQLIRASEVVENVHNCGHIDVLPANEAQVRPLLRLEPDQQIAAWKQVVKTAKDKKVTAQLVEKAVLEIAEEPEGPAKFNPVNENIDWAKWSWNPLTGCKYQCNYCYAQQMAKRFSDRYAPNFAPRFYRERLAAPANMKIPQSREKEPGIRNVFTCSMGELFGDWVSQKWINDVLAAVCKAPQWNFLFLTKNPKRLVDIDWPQNAWVGTTVDKQSRVRSAIAAMKQVKAKVRYLSCEPLLEELKFPTMECFDWVIIGAQSSHGGQPEQQPDPKWVKSLIDQAWDAGCKVYCKPNLKALIKEYPQIDAEG